MTARADAFATTCSPVSDSIPRGVSEGMGAQAGDGKTSLNTLWRGQTLVGPVGLEPTTYGLKEPAF